MRTQRQGVRSTKTQQPTRDFTPEEATPVQTPIPKKKEIFISIYSPKNTMYTGQTGKFPHASIRGNNYQMVIHEIYGASTWIEVMKKRTEGEIIEARSRGLNILRQQGITPAHQVLDNKRPQTYKTEIR